MLKRLVDIVHHGTHYRNKVNQGFKSTLGPLGPLGPLYPGYPRKPDFPGFPFGPIWPGLPLLPWNKNKPLFYMAKIFFVCALILKKYINTPWVLLIHLYREFPLVRFYPVKKKLIQFLIATAKRLFKQLNNLHIL